MPGQKFNFGEIFKKEFERFGKGKNRFRLMNDYSIGAGQMDSAFESKGKVKVETLEKFCEYLGLELEIIVKRRS
jgi:hypothetical protein